MQLYFHKYEGAGNDFIILDNREGHVQLGESQVKKCCDRRFGIGSDGLLLLENVRDYDFEMVYFNADGRKADMCGNGGRCIAAFARRLKIIDGHTTFLAGDGPHEALVLENGTVDLKMQDVTEIRRSSDTAILNTGVPHFVKYVDRLDSVDVREEGRKIRYSNDFRAEGINVDFMEYGEAGVSVRTYERGVEDETLACGTGVTAAAIVAAGNRNQSYTIPVRAKGGSLQVRFDKAGDQEFRNIWLSGPANFIFEGNIYLD
jgi:diaminopimelate epimerase